MLSTRGLDLNLKFHTIIITGLGLIGGSLAAALRKLGVAKLIGIDHG